MPRLARQPAAPRTTEVHPSAASGSNGSPRELVIAWSVSREAMAGAGVISSDGAGSVLLELRIPWCEGETSATSRVATAVIDGERRIDIPVEAGQSPASVVDEDAGLTHLDVPGIACVSVRRSGTGIDVIYARTELLARLGIPGGRYDLQRAGLAES